MSKRAEKLATDGEVQSKILGKTEVPPRSGSCRAILVFELTAWCLPRNLAHSLSLSEVHQQMAVSLSFKVGL